MKSPFVLCRRVGAPATAAIVAAAVVVIVVSSVIAADGDVPGWERDILTFFNDWPDGLEPVLWLLQQPGVLFAPLVAGLIIVRFTGHWHHLVPFVAILPLKLLIEKGLVKQLVERDRPFESIGPEIEVRGPAFEGLSFPSGHATTAFAMFILIAAFLPNRWRFLPVVFAVIVGVARLYYGEHNALDVLAGAAMGTAFATILWFTFLNRWVGEER